MKILSNEPVYDLYTQVTDFRRSSGALSVNIWMTLRPTLYAWVIDNRRTAMARWEQI